MTVIVRTSLPAASIAPALRQAVRDLDAGLPPPEVNEVRTNRAEASAAPRFNLWLFGTFAGVALALALTGVYATLAFTIAERRREIAVRLALGASPGGVLRLVLRTGLAFALAGIAAGTAAALGTTTMLGSLLFEVGPTDPRSFGAAVVVLLATSAVACYLPARRAARLEPAAILRE
jgi:ABC-type antimicrobial peptide transport system permease subunit